MATLTFAEEILLIALDDETGKFLPMGAQGLRYPLVGAVLMDLALRAKIHADVEKVEVLDSTPTGEESLDGPLAEIAEESEEHGINEWLNRLMPRAEDVEAQALERLVARGILRREERRFLWVFSGRRYPVIDNTEEKEVKRRIVDILLTDEAPRPRDIALISLVDACDLMGAILSTREVDNAALRVEQIRKLDVIGRAMTNAIRNLRVEIAKSMTAPGGFPYT